ncbi:hypothetical protein [Flavobacterium sp. H122]|uniref:hypothetical protein n=1 Tax=Flavobacterium sp. H122 TaxID=2529860 RepID=UPI0010AA0CA4|nr:hypothetical protein [Flavobacterium sp. H122]
MGEIPSTFLSKKTFQSLPQLAFWTWFTVFIIDAVVLQRFTYSFMRVAAIWGIGLTISFIFELVRYRNMKPNEKAEYGNKFFFLLNAFLIFFYAASFTGLTKQIGAWGELVSNVNQHGKNLEQSNILLAAQEWAIPILAKQTSYFPDITVIAENNQLKEENSRLKNGLSGKDIKTTAEVDSLTNRIDVLKDSLKICNKNIQTITSLTEENNRYKGQINVLLTRINDFNLRQSKWKNVKTFASVKSAVNELIRGVDKNEGDYYEFIFNTPINPELPQYNNNEPPVK